MKLSVKDSRIVEKIVKKDNKEYISDIMALMFKRTDLTNAEQSKMVLIRCGFYPIQNVNTWNHSKKNNNN